MVKNIPYIIDVLETPEEHLKIFVDTFPSLSKPRNTFT